MTKGAASRADEYEVEELVSKNPKASDEELLEKGLKSLYVLDMNGSVGPDFEKFVLPYMQDVFVDTSEWGDVEIELDGPADDILLTAKCEGKWFEIPDDPGQRVEIPAREDLHDSEIEAALKKAGAYSAVVEWRLDSPMEKRYESSYDAVQYSIRAKWKVNWDEVGRRYGREAFIAQFKKSLHDVREALAKREAESDD